MATKKTKTFKDVTTVTTVNNDQYIPLVDADGKVTKTTRTGLLSVAQESTNGANTYLGEDNSGNLLKVGYLDLLSQLFGNVPTIGNSFNTVSKAGVYWYGMTNEVKAEGAPASFGILIVMSKGVITEINSWIWQIFLSTYSGLFYRVSVMLDENKNRIWSSWTKFGDYKE